MQKKQPRPQQKRISSPNDIDLLKHGIIEAHAGTGKTYTIVKLVIRMLEQKSGFHNDFIQLKEILLVTYTEKAAGELKKRIIDGISERIKELRSVKSNENLILHLESCLNNMHEALIGTIHGVCLRLLQTWPFETGVHFSTQITDDEEGVQGQLRESMRTEWQDESTNIPQAMRTLEQRGVKFEEKHFNLICKIALALMNDDNLSIDIQPDIKVQSSDELLSIISIAGKLLAKRCKAYKKQNGFISYNDMLQLMNMALNTENSPLHKTLRLQLRYGIIDEFQDTSVLQWSIFKKIFLDEEYLSQNSAKMFIVGDPKQSIYSFQNADIQSYINAKKVMIELGGTVYSLIDNYRSLPEVIDGYNAILNPENSSEDWFFFGEESGNADSITYQSDESARAPKRTDLPQYPLNNEKAVKIISLTGKESDNRKSLTGAICCAIRKLKGKTVSVPDGLKWKNLTLDYKDFAVIVETHALAQPFIDELRIQRIPCVKYKQKGVFNSVMARDLRALLIAILKKDDNPAQISAMLTHFFNIAPHLINRENDLNPCSNPKYGNDEMCCAYHSFDNWSFLADKQLWAQLFKSILEKTKIRQRLILLTDGERRLADLRQVTDYCIEWLYSKNCGLHPLIDHLERLYTNEESAGGDKNIHTLSTEKSSVKILTMHAAKGLEFPVVFVVNSEKKELPKSPNFLIWNDKTGKIRKLTPYLNNPKENPQLSLAVDSYNISQKQERRRLLYVALTRPQVMLFAVMRGAEKEGELSPRLKELIKEQNPYTELFDEDKFLSPDLSNNSFHNEKTNTESSSAIPKEIPNLLLKPFITIQTSYSQLSRKLNSHRDIDKSEEYSDDDTVSENNEKKLPGGRAVGDALHRVIEELLSIPDLRTALGDENYLANITAKYLKRGGVLNLSSIEESEDAVKEASQYIKNALTAPLSLPCGVTIDIAGIPKHNRIPEMEFLLSSPPHWIGGFMDLVFRVRNESYTPHPYRYYIVDWKSDNLNFFDQETIRRHCINSHYDLQAKIYCRALHKYLKGVLANRYDPAQNLGGSLHLFLRGFKTDSISGINTNLWMRKAAPAEDENDLQKYILNNSYTNSPINFALYR